MSAADVGGVDQAGPAFRYLDRLDAGSSRRTVRSALDQLARTLSGDANVDHRSYPWCELRATGLEAARAGVVDRYAPATANRILGAARGVLDQVHREGRISTEEYVAAVATAANVRYHRAVPPVGAGRTVTGDDIGRLRAICENGGAAGLRDVAIIALLYGAGLRRVEIVALDACAWSSSERTVEVPEARGRPARCLGVAEGVAAAVSDWHRARGTWPGPLMVPVTRDGRAVTRRLTGSGVAAIVARRARQAGLVDVTPQHFRASFMSELLGRGVDLAEVSAAAGNRSHTTTAGYGRPEDQARRAAPTRVGVAFDVPAT